MKRRTVLAAAAAALSGCIGTTGLGPTTTTTAAGPLVQAGPGEYPHEVVVANGLDRAATLALRVEREESTLYERRHEVEAGQSRTVAGFLREEFPNGERYVTVVATNETGRRESVGVSVTDCLGDVLVTLSPDDPLDVTYSIC